jgi:hypothetical protein
MKAAHLKPDEGPVMDSRPATVGEPTQTPAK